LLRLFLTLLFILPGFLKGQELFTWSDYSSYNSIKKIILADGLVYGNAEHGLISLNTDNQSVERVSKVNYLSDVSIADIDYSKSLDLLVIGYSNGNIDLLRNNTVFNIQDLKRTSQITNRTIYGVHVTDSVAFISFGSGILKLNLLKSEVEETFSIGTNTNPIEVYCTAVKDDTIFAATSEGVHFSTLSNPLIKFPSAWSKKTGIIHPNDPYQTIVNFNGAILFPKRTLTFKNDTLYQLAGKTSVVIPFKSNDDLNGLSVTGDKIVISHSYSIGVYDQNFNLISNYYDYFIDTKAPAPNFAVLDDQNTLWVADKKQGIAKSINVFNTALFKPTCPEGSGNRSLATNGEKLYVARGEKGNNWFRTFTPAGIYIYEDYDWTSKNQINEPVFDTISDIVCVAVDPTNSKRLIVGSLGHGIFEFEDDIFKKRYISENSTLEYIDGFGTGVTHVDFDNGGNLFVSTSITENLLNVQDPDGNWASFVNSSVNGEKPTALEITSGGQAWLGIQAIGIMVVDYNNTATDVTDDQVKILTSSVGNGNLPGSEINTIAEDKNGEVWIGSNKGLRVVYNPSNVFLDGGVDAEEILIKQGLYFQILLETEAITVIEIDGGNNKWIGTENSGVFLMSPDGTEEIYHFTESNSPLWSNTIHSIKVNETTGEVFIGTDKGLISFKGSETEPASSLSGIYAYPNPVTPNYEGDIAITGLVRGTEIRIADVAGNIVHKTTSTGGQVIWDRSTLQENKVNTGVYIIYASSLDGQYKANAKIVILNK